MSVRIHHGSSDAIIDEIITALEAYETDHPDAQIDVYRQNSVSVRVRVVDPAFAAWTRTARHENVWAYLNRLPEETVAEISMLVLVEPGEENSLANIVFEEPLPSKL